MMKSVPPGNHISTPIPQGGAPEEAQRPSRALLKVASPEEIRALPDVRSWLDWMERTGAELVHASQEDVRRRILDGVLAHLHRPQPILTEDDFAEADVRIHTLDFPDDFDVYGDLKRFYLPAVIFKSTDELISAFMKLGFFFQTSACLHVDPKTLGRDPNETVAQFISSTIRPVSVLLAPRRGLRPITEAHGNFAVDPLAMSREKEDPKANLVGRWIGFLRFARSKKSSPHLAQGIIDDREIYYRMIHPETFNATSEDRGISRAEAVLYGSFGLVEVGEKISRGDAFEAKQKAEVEEFMETRFGRRLGFQPRAGMLQLTELFTPPIFNFLKLLVKELGYGKALSLLMRSPNITALMEVLDKDHPEIDFASSAYNDVELIRRVIYEGTF